MPRDPRGQRGLRFYDHSDPREPSDFKVIGISRDVNVPGVPRYSRDPRDPSGQRGLKFL